MNKLQKLIMSPNVFRLMIIIAGILIVLMMPSRVARVNDKLNKVSAKLSGEKQVDPAIVIISIGREDIENSGGWPISRKIYAEAIDSLTKLGVWRIGLGIMLSGNNDSDTGNAVLQTSIKKSGRVVLPSVLVNGNNAGAETQNDTIIYSSPKESDPSFRSGHLNFIQRSGIYVPSFLKINGRREFAYAEMLGEGMAAGSSDLVKINVYTSWKNFNRITLTDFLNTVRKGEGGKLDLENKIVLIGTIDPPQAQTFETVFDDSLPGVGFQALVLDNLITGRSINYRSGGITIIFAVLLLLIMSRLASGANKFIIYSAALAVYLLAAYLFLNNYRIEANYAVFLLPWILLLLYDLIFARRASKLISGKSGTP